MDQMMSRNESSRAPSATASTLAASNYMLSSAAATKLCHIVKRADFEGYGFNLHSEKSNPGQYIGKVDIKSPAETAGLKEGDRIIEVNGVTIGSETHKQVVQRIKAIACEVRLLLIDVDGNGGAGEVGSLQPLALATASNENTSSNKATEADATTSAALTATNGKCDDNYMDAYHGTVQEMPGASANISSISMISTKRTSSASNQSNSRSSSSNSNNNSQTYSNDTAATTAATGVDVTNKATIAAAANISYDNTDIVKTPQHMTANSKNNNAMTGANSNIMMPTIPLPPSAAIATVPQVANSSVPSNVGAAGVKKAGCLQLPMTAAEMRAKLLAKKKYDPKNESVDLKKKFEIIQKL